MLINILIIIIRFPLAIIAIFAVIVITVIGAIIEIPIALIYLIFISIFGDKSSFEDSWITHLSNSMSNDSEIIMNILAWGFIPNSNISNYTELNFPCTSCRDAFNAFNGISAFILVCYAITVLNLWLVIIIGAVIIGVLMDL